MGNKTGILIEEFVAFNSHHFDAGKLSYSDNSTQDGEYTGRFCFKPVNGLKEGKTTKWYTQRTAPKWLMKLYDEAVVTHE